MDNRNFGDSVERAVERVVEFLPQLAAALLILIIGYFISRILDGLTRKALMGIGFDRALQNSAVGSWLSRIITSPARFVGSAVFWLVFFAFITFAVAALDLPVLNDILNGIYSYIPNIIAAVAIFLVASAISGGAAGFAQRVMNGTPTAKLVTAVVPAVTMSLALFMILDQLNIAESIVNILFTAIVGSLALGLALAFGLGGRDVARQLLEQAYDTAQNNATRVKADSKQAVRSTKSAARRAR